MALALLGFSVLGMMRCDKTQTESAGRVRRSGDLDNGGPMPGPFACATFHTASGQRTASPRSGYLVSLAASILGCFLVNLQYGLADGDSLRKEEYGERIEA